MNRADFLESMRGLAESVWDFHDRFDLPNVEQINDEDFYSLMHRRITLMSEEHGEMAQAVNRHDKWSMTDESADVLFVAMGHIVALDDVAMTAVEEVKKKNNAKTLDNYWFNGEKVMRMP